MRAVLMSPGEDNGKGSERASGSPMPTIKGQRQSHAKVKSGCLTCKIRRVKCDETKPSCLRCTSTQRKCDGYKGKEPLKFINTTAISTDQIIYSRHDAPRPSFPRLTGSPRNPFLDFSGTEMEHRSLDFFRYETAPALSGYFDADFWNVLLPRIGHSEPPVQHAMIALGSLYEYCNGSEAYPSIMQQRYALVQYNKAIRALKSCRADDPKTMETTLLTCLLFVCLELLAGNPEQALNHLQNGLGILRHSKSAKDRISLLHLRDRASSRKSLPKPQSIMEVLSDAFSRLSIQGSLCSRRKPEVYPNQGWSVVEDSQSARVPFDNLQQARLSLNEMFVQCLQPMDPLEGADHPANGIEDLKRMERDILVEQLHHWNSRLGLYVTDSLPNLAQEEIKGSHVLRLLSLIGIMLTTTTDLQLETAYDAHFEEHQIVINLALSIIGDSIISSPATTSTLSSRSASSSSTLSASSSRSKRAMPSAFTFEMGIIPALYFTAIKCRSPSLRRRALDMLGKVEPRREGLWDARLLAAVAQRAIEIEEAEGCSDDAWPSEARRIHGIHMTPSYDSIGRKQDVVFTWRPDGLMGQWLHISESITY